MANRQARYCFDSEQRFVIENYNWAKAFSNFLPGIAGKWGIPMWIYYVSKAQAICSIGVQDKDHSIMEFLSFNRACQMVGKEGFRTFIKLDGGPVYEPFQQVKDETITQRMVISSHELELHERNTTLGLETAVVYFPLVNLPLAGLVRQVTIRNTSTETREVEVIDGVPRVLPYGVTFEHLKVIARHIEGMMGVYDVMGSPLFKLKQTPADTAEVGELAGGNYYCSLMGDGKLMHSNIIVDPSVVFGQMENHDFPWAFAHESIGTILGAHQVRENRTPCALTALNGAIPPGESLTFWSVIGHVPTEAVLERFLTLVGTQGFLEGKRAENREVIDQIKHTAFTVSGEPGFDQYLQQTFLDNVMRGGMPVTFESAQARSVFYVYLRQGGDLERDYHWFVLEPTYLSQGNGHYRNILQNRRAVHFIKMHRELARSILESVRRSGIYDAKLDMYKCCESLEGQPFEIGRIKAYARGWIENESVYTHMEYKWLLEILRSGLCEEFFEECRRILIPFLDPATYGRSTLENCSFIVSSAFPDVKLHGQAFQPRSSGVTCEMLHMWTIVVAGERPFFLDENRRLRLRLQPILPEWLFTKAEGTYRYWDDRDGWTDVPVPENCFAFKFIGRTLVIYHNEKRQATFGKDGAQVGAYTLEYRDGTVRTVRGDSLDTSPATDVRDGQVRRMDVILA